MFHHDSYKFRETGLCRVPTQQRLGFSRVTQQLFHFAGAEIFRIHFHHCLSGFYVDTFLVYAFAFPAQFYAGFLKGKCGKFAYGVHLSGSNHEVFRRIVLQDKPHTFHIVFGISPVAACIQITQIQLVLESLCNACGSQCNLACNESLAAAFALMVKEDTVHGIHVIAFAVVLRNPETILFGYAIRAARIERSRLLLRHFLHLTEQFRSRCLINSCLLLHAQNAHGFQHTQRTYRIGFRRVFGYVERNFHVALCGKIINFIRLHLLYDADERAAVRHISIVQVHQAVFLHVAYPFIQVQMFDTSGIERR